MNELLNKLNPEQAKAVVTTDGPLLVLAGAGSGKTRVLTYRIAYLISEKNVAPWSILAITFTNKAAAEMRKRLFDLVGDGAEDMWIRTFHSACVRILRRDIDKIGFGKDFTIYDSADQKTLVKDCIKELNLSDKEYPVSTCLSYISGAKNAMVDTEEYRSINKGNFRMEHYCKVYELYEKKLKKYNAVDFDDLLVLTVRLFEECPDILEYYRNKFTYIHIDEYQDTNMVQCRLVTLLAEKHRNLCVVGDEDQSIYKFRGADIKNILKFEEAFPDAAIIRLEQNYRSTQTILDAANHVISKNSERLGKHLWTDKGEGKKIVKYFARTEHDEGYYIASEMQRLNKEENIPYSDMVVLYRMNAQSRAIEEQLIRQAVPYRIIAGHRFYDSREIKDVIAYLRVVNNPNDDISLVRIINEPKRQIGNVSLGKAVAIAAESGKSIFEVISSPAYAPALGAAFQRMNEFSKLIEDIRAKVSSVSVSELITLILEKTGYANMYMGDDPEMKTRLENIKEFISVGVSYEKENETPSLADFLDNISLVADIDSYDENMDIASLMTLHSAKGLEFPVVFLCGFEEGIFPGVRALLERDEVEEERRLCYVGITRAQRMLYITHTQSRTLFGTTSYNRVSRFMNDIPPSLYEEKGGETQTASTPYTYSKSSFEKEHSLFTGSNSKPAQNTSKADYSVGEHVIHKKFGKGVICEAIPVGNDTKLVVDFEGAGKKPLLALYANLTKI